MPATTAANKERDMNIIENQEQAFIHVTLMNDLAYQWSVTNSDVQNMQMVLRAYGEKFTYSVAEKQIAVAKTLS
jgi:hypothetical protein